jgi:hypothetical protein
VCALGRIGVDDEDVTEEFAGEGDAEPNKRRVEENRREGSRRVEENYGDI